jgi:hypothetical protein
MATIDTATHPRWFISRTLHRWGCVHATRATCDAMLLATCAVRYHRALVRNTATQRNATQLHITRSTRRSRFPETRHRNTSSRRAKQSEREQIRHGTRHHRTLHRNQGHRLRRGLPRRLHSPDQEGRGVRGPAAAAVFASTNAPCRRSFRRTMFPPSGASTSKSTLTSSRSEQGCEAVEVARRRVVVRRPNSDRS